MIFIGRLAEMGFNECVRGYKNASHYTIKTKLQGGKYTVANSCNMVNRIVKAEEMKKMGSKILSSKINNL